MSNQTTGASDKDDSADETSVASREAVRKELDEQIQAFLAKGGKIETVDPHVTADPPQKPSNNYTSRPI